MATGQLDIVDPNQRYPDVFRFMENSFLQFLQAIFSQFPPKNLHYDPIDENTDIKIEGQRTDNLRQMDTRPKIVVGRGPVAWGNTTIGNFVGSANLSQFKRTFTDINDGSVAISAFSREDLEADRIAQICFDAVKEGREILQRFGYLQISSAQAGSRGIIRGNESRPELTVVPVVIRVKITRNWRKVVSDPVLLKDYLLQLNST